MNIIKKECPYCHKVIEGNIKTFANHVRWCKCNPKYNQILEGTLNKLKVNKVPRNEYHFKCVVCNKDYSLILTENNFTKGKYRKTCSDECAKVLTNQNTDLKAKNQKVSETIQKKINDGTFMLPYGRKYEGSTLCQKVCPLCKKEFTTLRKNKKYCSVECAREAKREKDLKNKEELHIYRLMAKFQFGIKNYPEEFDFKLIQDFGWYEAPNRGDNPKGVSRDHMFSVNEGYKQGIDPYYISHPANCKLMRQEDNFKKLTKCSITKEELFQRVKEWNEKYGVYENKINYRYIEKFKE